MALPTETKQWTTKQDGINKLEQETASLPKLADGEVLVKVLAVSLNYRDTEVIRGEYNHHKTVSQGSAGLVPCSDMCGLIIQSASKKFSTGERVLSIFNQTHTTGQVVEENMASGLGLPTPGVLTEYRIFPEYGLVKTPDYLSDEQASTLAIAAVTSWMSINWNQPIGDHLKGQEKTVLLQGTGGVSIAGLQIAKACGMKTIITSSSDKKLEQAKALGATHTINYKTDPNWDTTVLSLTNNKGVDIILETGGALTLPKSFSCIAFGGTIAAIGYLGGKEEPKEGSLNVNVLALKRNVTIKGILNGPRDRFEELLGVYEMEKIVPVVDKVFTFEQAKEALLYLESGGHFGKVVVKVGTV
ncbi:hypothetical protein EG328_007412 [Venturia inaequalis]|nr:hypothetical protein EG328_007412 [Venturia inaequalis]RDI82933.1 hypothetical protein Vi05172_g7217 [Venturia inaequalis]